MHSQKNDKALTSTGFMLICEVELQDSKSGKNENKRIEKYIYQYTLFTLATLSNIFRSCASPDTFRFEQGDSLHSFFFTNSY